MSSLDRMCWADMLVLVYAWHLLLYAVVDACMTLIPLLSIHSRSTVRVNSSPRATPPSVTSPCTATSSRNGSNGVSIYTCVHGRNAHSRCVRAISACLLMLLVMSDAACVRVTECASRGVSHPHVHVHSSFTSTLRHSSHNCRNHKS